MSLFHALKSRKGRVLFVCLGNSVRSQMAEAFARAYGSDVVEADSAGLTPATKIASKTIAVMSERHVSLEGQTPKSMASVDLNGYDLVVNMSGYALPRIAGVEVAIEIRDPLGKDENAYRHVRDAIENHVQSLVDHLRAARDMQLAGN